MAVGVHAQADAERLAEPPQLSHRPQAAPVVMIARITCTLPLATAGGMSAQDVIALLLASGVSIPGGEQSPRTSAISASPGTGSSRYSSAPARAVPTRIEVSTDHAPFGSIRRGHIRPEGVAQGQNRVDLLRLGRARRP